jgi:hypothetical protein
MDKASKDEGTLFRIKKIVILRVYKICLRLNKTNVVGGQGVRESFFGELGLLGLFSFGREP